MKIKVNKVDTNPKWKVFEMKNDSGMEVHILNFGGKITKILTEDKSGQFENVVLGYENFKDYENDPNFLGTLVGPVAGRVEGGTFSIGSEVYHLEKNDRENTLHSGSTSFQNVLWEGNPFMLEDSIGLELKYESKDGEFGFPGNKLITVTYYLTNNNELIIDYKAITDKATPIILTNHTYFNLSGGVKETIEDHTVQFNSTKYAELDNELIPTGQLLDTDDTPFDFKSGRKLSEGIHSNSEQNQIVGEGFDHYFFFDDEQRQTVLVNDKKSGRNLRIETNHPGMVMYTSNNLEEGLKLDGGRSEKYLGVCFETQEFPGGIKDKRFSDVIVNPEKEYHKRTKYTFEVSDS